jgi:hypothetical protein
MRFVVLALLLILALNALVIVAVACILLIDHLRAKRRAAVAAGDEESHAKA